VQHARHEVEHPGDDEGPLVIQGAFVSW